MSDQPRRADARRNHERLLAAAGDVVAEQGTQASLREVARRAEVGLGTLYRHFPTRDALLEALLRQRFDDLAEAARELADAAPEQALTEWLRRFLAGSTTYRGLATSMMATLGDEGSPLSASCHAMREAAGALLLRAQESGHVRSDVDRLEVFALVSALGWIADEAPVLADRTEHLFSLVMDALRADATRRDPHGPD
jgi:AcrR family transcriptional regulator